MSLKPVDLTPIPEDTVRVAKTAFPKGNIYIKLRDELGALYHDLLIGVTKFFRDPDSFAVLQEKVIPEILARVPENEEIRVWVAACATGDVTCANT